MSELPPELSMDMFESAMASIDVTELDVIDEVGESDNEQEKSPKKREREKSRTRTHRNRNNSRNRSRSPRRYARSRSRSRERPRRRSPPKSRKSPVAKKGGAADFLQEMQKEFGEFEGLKEVRSKVESKTILNTIDRSPNRGRRNNNYRQNKQQQNNQYQQNMNGMAPNQMMMGMNPMMMAPMMPYPNQMPMMNPGYCGPLLGPPGVEPMNYNMPYMAPQQQQQPLRTLTIPVQVPEMPGRNASPPTDIDLGNLPSKLLSQNKLPLSDFLQTQASTNPRGASKTIEARSSREKILSKCKAALHRLQNASQFDRNFLHVPPSYPSDETEPIGASPILPTKHNVVFRFSTKNRDAIKNCRPYPSITRNVAPLIAQLGVDESVIARRLESTTKERQIKPPEVSNNFTNFSYQSVVLPAAVRPPMKDGSCQTPVLACAKCDDRYGNLMNTGTQTAKVEKYSEGVQTDEADFTLAKLRLRNWEKGQQKRETERVQQFRSEYGIEENSEGEDSRTRRFTGIGPPGFREGVPRNAGTSSSRNSFDRYHDRY